MSKMRNLKKIYQLLEVILCLTISFSFSQTTPVTLKAKESKNPTLFYPNGNGFFVLYYGNPLEAKSDNVKIDGERIRDLRPNFVIVADSLYNNLKISNFFHYDENGKATNIRAIAYIASAYGKGNLKRLQARIEDAMAANYDGVFFDQVEDSGTNQNNLVDYYSTLSKEVKSYGTDNLVIFNPGKKIVEDWLFDWADIVSVENNGIENNEFNKPHKTTSGVSELSWRWLAVQGDPAKYGAKADDKGKEAKDRLKSFRDNKGFWYYSSPKAENDATHWILPTWLETFAETSKKQSVNCNEK